MSSRYRKTNKQNKTKNKLKFVLKKNRWPIIITAIVTIGVFLFITINERSSIHNTNNNSVDTQTENKYTLLENNDSIKYISKIILLQNNTIMLIAKEFYGNSMYWPLILDENIVQLKQQNPLDILKGTLLNIPRISPELLDTTNTTNQERMKHLGDSILTNLE